MVCDQAVLSCSSRDLSGLDKYWGERLGQSSWFSHRLSNSAFFLIEVNVLKLIKEL